jgi:hypothetical protein
MTMETEEYNNALRLFEKQIDYLIRDDRNAQMELYTLDLRYELPFASDRPRLIEGRERFRIVMTPMWEEARRKGVKVTGSSHKFHATDEAGLFVATFSLDVISGEKTMSLPFVQFIRIRGDRICEVREYFNPSARAEL